MARPSTKKAKVSAKPNSQKPNPSIGSTDYPPPFAKPSPDLTSNFLSTLDSKHIYIIHVDTTSSTLKRRVFLVPVCMNILIALGLLLRAYYALPVYFALVAVTFGHPSEASVDVSSSHISTLLSITASRTFLLLADYLLFAYVGSWPWNFMFGTAENEYGSPAKWRRSVGFQNREIIVRTSRKWDTALLPTWTIDDELTVKHKIMPAVHKDYLAKSGYLLLDKTWDLNFAAMVKAHKTVSEGHLKLEDFDKAVVVFHQPTKSWMIWQMGKEDLPKTAEQRDTLLKFKDKLVEIGHEDLFYRWVEIVQYESTMPGGFTEGRQAMAMREARRIFTERGIDFAKFWEEIGGQEGMPGLHE